MKSISHLRQLLSLSTLFQELGRAETARRLNKFVEVISGKNMRSARDILKPLAAISCPSGKKLIENEVWLRDLQAMLKFAEREFSKSFVKFFSSFVNECSRFSSMNFNDLIEMLAHGRDTSLRSKKASPASASPESIAGYVLALEEAMHDELKFPVVFSKLENDRAMKRNDVVEIASRFAFRMAKSTPKKVALQRIWDQFETSSLMGSKIESQDGRSAA